MELGGGLGLVSMCAALLGAAEVHLSDGDGRVLDAARQSLKENLLGGSAASAAASADGAERDKRRRAHESLRVVKYLWCGLVLCGRLVAHVLLC